VHDRKVTNIHISKTQSSPCHPGVYRLANNCFSNRGRKIIWLLPACPGCRRSGSLERSHVVQVPIVPTETDFSILLAEQNYGGRPMTP
jgi:hypothetical protein